MKLVRQGWQLFYLSLFSPLFCLAATAQIIPDQTLGNENSMIRNQDSRTKLIKGGATRGSNLFHSFREFNIKKGNTAAFENPQGIETIFSRVTGKNPSRLFGTLSVLGNANLFFINPHGIIFGPNAQINVNGSFVASTANSITFPNGSGFSATNPDTPSLLTIDVAVPVGLQFEGDTSGTIINSGNITSQQNIALIGKTVVNTGQIFNPSGTTSILTIGEGVVNLDATGKIISEMPVDSTNLSLVKFVQSEGEITGLRVDEKNQVRVINSGTLVESGDIVVEGAITAGEAINLSSAKDVKLVNSFLQMVLPEGDISLVAKGNISVDNSNVISSNIGLDNQTLIFEGNGGDIVLQANKNLTGSDSSLIMSRGELGGKIDLDIQGDISLVKTDVLSVNLGQVSRGTGGDITVNAKNLSMSDVIMMTVVLGTTNAGNVMLKVEDSIFSTYSEEFKFSNYSGTVTGILGSASFPLEFTTSGNVGNVSIETKKLTVTKSAAISASSEGLGKGGNISIKAKSIEITGSVTIPVEEIPPQFGATEDQIFGSTLATAVISDMSGNAGELRIETDSLLVANGGQIATATAGNGKAGNIIINAKTVEVLGTPLNKDGSIPPNFIVTVIVSAVSPETSGDGGNIIITTDSLDLTNDAQIQSGTFGTGNAGDIKIIAKSIEIKDSSRIEFESNGRSDEFGTGLFASTAKDSQGNGGNIEIQTNDLQVSNGGAISAETRGSGSAGNILINTNRLTNTNNAIISTTVGETSTTTEKAGNLIINASEVNLSDQSGLLVQTQNAAPGGTLILQPLNANEPLVINLQGGSQLSATSTGNAIAGDISVNNAQQITLDNSGIVVQTASNTGGNINLTITDLLTLENNSQISATAGTEEAGGDGGNIFIASEFIVANPFENSDITANAFTGRGGNIDISTDGIFGLEARDSLTALSDITALSEFGLDGNIILNTAGVDPIRGLLNLTEETVNSEISQGCQVSGSTNVSFYNVGRGGLPSSPDQLFYDSSAGILKPWVEEEAQNQSDNSFEEEIVQYQLILPCQSL